MNTYSVEVPVTLPRTVSYQTWQDKEVESRIAAYNSTNPLGISTEMNWLVIIFIPAVIITAGTMNIYALWVLQSNFLRCLVIQPLLEAFLYLQTFLLVVGPLYIWLVQCFGLYFSRSQLYPCFLLLWSHNFAMLATPSVLVAMIIERALSIGKSEIYWDIWQRACRHIMKLLLLAALVLAVGGMMCIDGTTEHKRVAYPICLPWWDNEHSSVSPLWYKILAFNFSFGPSILMSLSMVLLVLSLARFKHLIRSRIGALNHYAALYLEIRSTLHTKFVTSVKCLVSLFIIASSPLGCFIIFGPAIFTDIPQDYNSNGTAMTAGSDIVMETSSATAKYYYKMTRSSLPLLEYSYLLVSRCDIETMVWIAYYGFTVYTVPVLLRTEVLFSREWNGQLENIIAVLQCRKQQSLHWSGFDIDGSNNQDLLGPYIAKSDGPVSKADRVVAWSRYPESIKIYDAGKAARAGRIQGTIISGPGRNICLSKPQASNPDLKLNAKKVPTKCDDAMFRTPFVANRGMLKNMQLSSSDATAKIKPPLETETGRSVKN